MQKSLIILTLILVLTASAARADSFGLGFAGSFNAFVFGDFSSAHSDTEGRLAAGGNVNLSSYSVGNKLTPGQYNDVLIAGGNLGVTSGRIYGTALVAGTATLGHANVADGGVYTNQTLPFSFASEQSRLTGMSSSLSQFAPTGTVSNNWGGLTLTGNGAGGMQVFNISGDDLLSSWGLSLSGISDSDTVIINVSGLTAGMTNMNLENLRANNDKVLFNFFEATDLTFSGVAVQGSVLAPLADVDGVSGALYGTLIANSFRGSMELEHAPYTGATPIPAAAWLLGSGLFGLIGLRKFRRA